MIIRAIYLAAILSVLACSQAGACTLYKNNLANQDPTMDCPWKTKTFAERVSECLHWGDEYGYDKARVQQISQATKKLRCDRIEEDGKDLLDSYNAEPETQAVIKAILKIWIDG